MQLIELKADEGRTGGFLDDKSQKQDLKRIEELFSYILDAFLELERDAIHTQSRDRNWSKLLDPFLSAGLASSSIALDHQRNLFLQASSFLAQSPDTIKKLSDSPIAQHVSIPRTVGRPGTHPPSQSPHSKAGS